MFYALPSNWLQSHLVAKWQKGDSLETCPSAAQTSRAWHYKSVDIKTCETRIWHKTLFLHTSIFFWHMLRAKREISRSEQAGFCNHWLQYFMSCECEECKNHEEAKKGAHRTRYIEWTNKREVNENVYGAAYICILRFLRLITTPLFQQDSHCKSLRQFIVEPLKLTLLPVTIPLCNTFNPNIFR